MNRKQSWRRVALALGFAAVASANSALPVAAAQIHAIQPGETLSEIAEAYAVSIEAIAAANGISNVDLIYAGEQLTIPTPEPPPAPVAAPAQIQLIAAPATLTPGESGNYTIAPGDTIWDIAIAHGISIEALLGANPHISNPDQIYVGQLITIPGSRPAPPAALASRDEIGRLITKHASAYGFDPLLIQALAWQESGWQQQVVSASGAVGVMQILPDVGAWIASDIVGQPLDIAGSPSDNILAGVAYLDWLVNRSGNIELALASYYQGPGSVQRYGVLPETRQYVQNILAIRNYIAQNGSLPVV